MGALAGVFTKGSEDPRILVEGMLRALRHRGTQTRIASVEYYERKRLAAAVGYSAHHNPEAGFLESKQTVLAVDGSFFDVAQGDQVQSAHKWLVRKPSQQRATSGIMIKHGAFAALHYHNNCLHAFRDLNGLKPLFCSRTRTFVAFASERKALWHLGLQNVERVLPGHLYSVGLRGLTKVRLVRLPRPGRRSMSLPDASSQVARLLMRSIRRVTRGVEKIAVAFSGGLDSALTAHIAKQIHPEVHLFSIGLSGSSELSTVHGYARELGLPITVQAFSTDSLEKYVRRLVWLIEEPSLMKVSVAIPLHWAAMTASRHGFRVMLCGQGSDELYGGYYKYARTLDSKGRQALVAELYQSVIEASEVNYERDEQATAPFGVELRTPFSDLDLIRFSLGVPVEFKVRPGNDLVRKWVLREAAKKAQLPDDIVWRRKRAIQHGTGVENAIRKLAKSRNMTTDAYLTKMHAEVIKMESMP